MQPQQHHPNYDFIVNPQQASHRKSPGSGSKMTRILIVGGGLILLIVAFTIIKGIVTGGGNLAALQLVAQDQQELIHLTSGASQQPKISRVNLNFALTGKLVIDSHQKQLIAYMTQQKLKLNEKNLNLKVSLAVDKQLAGALASSTYDQTFQAVLKSQLTDYQTALKVAYSQTKGANGRKLLTTQYTSAALLQQQLATLDTN